MKEESMDVAMQKLLHIFNVIIDKSTGTEAMSLLKSYMNYVVISNAVEVLLIVFLLTVLIRLAVVGKYKITERNGELRHTSDKQLNWFLYGVYCLVASIISIICISSLP